MNEKIYIVVIKVIDRIKESVRFQNVLSKNHSLIKTRFGFHELNESKCSRNGLVILELDGKDSDCNEFITELKDIGGIKVEIIIF